MFRFQRGYVIATSKKANYSSAYILFNISPSVNSTNIQRIHTIYPTCTLVPYLCYLW